MKYIKGMITFLSLSFLLLPQITYAQADNLLIFDYPQFVYENKEELNRPEPEKSLNTLLFNNEEGKSIEKKDKKPVLSNEKKLKDNAAKDIKIQEKQAQPVKKSDSDLKVAESISANTVVVPPLNDSIITFDNDLDLSKYSTAHKKIISVAKSLIGVPYVYGGNTTKGLDCSGYVKYCYKQAGIEIPRTTYTQIKLGKSVNIADIDVADLIFFDTVTNIPYSVKNVKEGDDGIFAAISVNPFKKLPSNASHVGIYIGNGKFMHASSYNRKIVVENLDSPYFKNRIIDIKRYI